MLALTETQEFLAIQQAVRAVVTRHVAAAVPHPDRSAEVPISALHALADMGLLAPRSVADGGQGVPSQLEWTMIAEELGRADAGTALNVVLCAYADIIIGRCGDVAQRHALLTSRADSLRATTLYFEGFGRSPVDIETAATGLDSDDHWALAGRKTSVTNAADSDHGVVIARVGTELSAFYISGHLLAGLVAGPHAAHDTSTLGVRAARLSTIELSGIRAVRLANAHADTLHRIVAELRLTTASIMLGTADAAIDYAADYAATRQAFGQPIAGFQGVAFPLVDAQIGVDAARLAVRDLAGTLGTDVDDAKLSAGDAHQLADATSRAVAGAAQASCVATATAVNTLGGHGYLTDHPVERWYRDVAALSALDFDPLLIDWSARS